MAYTDNNTPVIEKITLPSGNTYFIADREIRDVVDALSQTIAGGVSYIIAWDGTATPTIGNIPAGVVVTYNDAEYTGTLGANAATPGAFYLVKSVSQSDAKDIYEEYVPVGPDGNKTWERIGNTQIDLSNIITSVTLSKQTDTVIGSDATFNTSSVASSVTPTTRKLATSSITGVQSSTTTASKANAATSQTTADGTGTTSTTNTDWLKGVSVSNGVLTIGAATMDTQTTTQFTFSDVTVPIKAASATTVATGSVTTSGSGADVVTGVAVGDTVNAVTGWNSKDSVTVLTNQTDVSVSKG